MVRLVVLASSTVLAHCVLAGTVGWWRFEERSSGEAALASDSVTNSVSASLGAGAAISIDGTAEETVQDLMPRYSSPAHGLDAVQIYDPVSGVSLADSAAMSFGTAGATPSAFAGLKGGAVRIPDDPAFRLRDFTVEMFVCTTGGLFNTIAPLVGKIKAGNWVGESWQIGLLANGKLFMRHNAKASGTSGDGTHIVNDGAWHHVAMTCSYDESSGESTYSMYVDYELDFSKTTSGAIAYGTSGNNDIYVGGYGYSGGRKFNGTVDELRISDKALSKDEFLVRRHAVSPFVDGDTVAYLSFDGLSGYSFNMATNRLGVVAKVVGQVERASQSADVPAAALRCGFTAAAATSDPSSLFFRTNGVSRAGTLLQLPSRAYTATNLTVELFFRTCGRLASSGDAQMLFKISESPYLQAMLAADSPGQIRIVYNNYFSGSAVWSSFYIGSGLDDGEWRHLAVVYDACEKTLACYIDHTLAEKKSSVVLASSADSAMIGSRLAGDMQFFHGCMDSVRITQRALSVTEMLNATSVVMHEEPGTVFRAALDGDYSVTAANPSWLVYGTGAKRDESSDACHLPVFSESVKWPQMRLDGRDGDNVATNQASVFLDGSTVTFADVPDMGAYDQTVEFFCNISNLNSLAGIVRLNNDKSAIIGANPLWALYAESDGLLRIRCTTIHEDVVDGLVYLSTDIPYSSLGGGWHHFAMTMERQEAADQTMFSLYVDGELVRSLTTPGALYYDSAKGANIMIGASPSAGADAVEWIDEVRVSRGVLDPSEFLCRYRQRNGILMIVR